MAEELKELIEKINTEAVEAAEDKAKIIEAEARRRADDIIRKAQDEAKQLAADAKDRVLRTEESGRASLKQAARDVLLALRKEISAMLDTLVTSHVHRALSVEEMAGIIETLVKECGDKEGGGIIISLKKEDLEKLEKGLLGSLRDQVKKGITLKASDDIRGGFIISYDSGRSCYDFTDKALAEYITLYLKPKLSKILSEAAF